MVKTMIESSILLTINLRGNLGGPVKSVDLQTNTVDVSPIGAKHPEWMTNRILHTDRTITPCTRKLTIDASTVNFFASDECPKWERLSDWVKKDAAARIESHLRRYDEGCGFTYSFFED